MIREVKQLTILGTARILALCYYMKLSNLQHKELGRQAESQLSVSVSDKQFLFLGLPC